MTDYATFWDVLIPGVPDRWPAASAAIDGDDAVLAALPATERAWLARQVAMVAATAPEARTRVVQWIEREAPAAFARVLSAVYGAYYTSAAVQHRVRELADTLPRDPSASFDPTLLAQVRERQPGRRRF